MPPSWPLDWPTWRGVSHFWIGGDQFGNRFTYRHDGKRSCGCNWRMRYSCDATEGYHQSADQIKIMSAVTKAQMEVAVVDAIPDIIANAFRVATQPHAGALYIDLHLDVGLALTDLQATTVLPAVSSAKVDIIKFAESFGARGYKVSSADQLVPTIRAALAGEGPVLVEIPIDYKDIPKLYEALHEHTN
jgi:thiamine pyrophosphate-dependent acetolactate synthase large subunit-like protein